MKCPVCLSCMKKLVRIDYEDTSRLLLYCTLCQTFYDKFTNEPIDKNSEAHLTAKTRFEQIHGRGVY